MNSTYAPGVMLSPKLVAELVEHLNSHGSTLGVPEAAARAIRAWISGAPPAPPAPPPADAEPARGFQWKNLFLPSGTELRMATREDTYYARVSGDFVVFEGRRYSPHGLMQHLAGSGRNAWRDVWIRFAGERHFMPASRLRREQERLSQRMPPDPSSPSIASQPPENAPHLPPPHTAAPPVSHALAPAPVADAPATATVPASATAPASATVAAPAIATVPATEAEGVAPAAVAMSEAFKSMLALMERLRPRATPYDERRLNRARREDDILADHCLAD